MFTRISRCSLRPTFNIPPYHAVSSTWTFTVARLCCCCVYRHKTNMTRTLSFFARSVFCVEKSFRHHRSSSFTVFFCTLCFSFHYSHSCLVLIRLCSTYVNIMKKDSSRMWIILHHPLRVNITSSRLIRAIHSCWLYHTMHNINMGSVAAAFASAQWFVAAGGISA